MLAVNDLVTDSMKEAGYGSHYSIDFYHTDVSFAWSQSSVRKQYEHMTLLASANGRMISCNM
jgi:hypothetical protein